MRWRPVVTSWATAENSRSRRRRCSHRRAWPVRASRGIQARMSSAIWTISSQIWFCAGVVEGEVAQSGGAGGADAVLGAGPLAVAQLQLGDRSVLGVGGEAGQPHAVGVGVGEAQLGAGVRPFLPHDQPHPLGPGLEAVAGEFGDPGAVADLAAGLDGRRPGRCRNLQHMLVDRLGDHHADRVGQPPSPPGQPADEFVGAARGIGADQGPAPAPVLLQQLVQGQSGGGDVVSCRVRSRVAWAEESRLTWRVLLSLQLTGPSTSPIVAGQQHSPCI